MLDIVENILMSIHNSVHIYMGITCKHDVELYYR